MEPFEQLAERICWQRAKTIASRALLVGISGIDGSGKGYVTAELEHRLTALGHRIANINVDGWLNLPQVRFSNTAPAKHFYENSLRLDEMLQSLIRPLRSTGSIRVDMPFASEMATEYQTVTLDYHNVDIVLLEGIFLFKASYRAEFDFRVWIDCSFDTALDRAVLRRQEGLAAEETVDAYRNIYFPAQELHFVQDQPRESSHIIFCNDNRIKAGVGMVVCNDRTR